MSFSISPSFGCDCRRGQSCSRDGTWAAYALAGGAARPRLPVLTAAARRADREDVQARSMHSRALSGWLKTPLRWTTSQVARVASSRALLYTLRALLSCGPPAVPRELLKALIRELMMSCSSRASSISPAALAEQRSALPAAPAPLST